MCNLVQQIHVHPAAVHTLRQIQGMLQPIVSATAVAPSTAPEPITTKPLPCVPVAAMAAIAAK